MESGQLRKLNLCYAGIQSLYWAGFAAIWAFLSVLLLYRGFSNSQIGTVSALALLMPLAVQPVLASLADRDRRFTSRRLAMALTGLLLLCAVGLWCSAGSMAVTAALYVLVGISLTATAPFHSAMARAAAAWRGPELRPEPGSRLRLLRRIGAGAWAWWWSGTPPRRCCRYLPGKCCCSCC